MTERREMGNAAKEAVNRAAENVNEASGLAESLIASENDQLPPHAIVGIATIHIKLSNALRWLESIGAQTRPQ